MVEINIFVKNLSGKTMVFLLTSETTIGELKIMIRDKIGGQFKDIYLSSVRPLDNDKSTINEYGILNNSTIYLLARLKGGLFD